MEAQIDRSQHLAKLGTVGLGVASCFAEHLLASGLGQLPHPGVNALSIGRYPCIPVNHGLVLHIIYAPEKPIFFNVSILVHNS